MFPTVYPICLTSSRKLRPRNSRIQKATCKKSSRKTLKSTRLPLDSHSHSNRSNCDSPMSNVQSQNSNHSLPTPHSNSFAITPTRVPPFNQSRLAINQVPSYDGYPVAYSAVMYNTRPYNYNIAITTVPLCAETAL